MNVRVHDAARNELEAAAVYYERQAAGLGAAFVTEVEQAFDLLRETPRVGVPALQQTRRVLLSRFPFAIVYRINDPEILIVAVAHQRRRPDYWKDRR